MESVLVYNLYLCLRIIGGLRAHHSYGENATFILLSLNNIIQPLIVTF